MNLEELNEKIPKDIRRELALEVIREVFPNVKSEEKDV